MGSMKVPANTCVNRPAPECDDLLHFGRQLVRLPGLDDPQ